MKLKDLLSKVSAEDQIIYLLVCNEWVSAFPAAFMPKEFENYIVEDIVSDKFDGDSPFDGIAVKCRIR